MDGARQNYRIRYEGDECCKTMTELRDAGLRLDDLTIAARRLSGERLSGMRFCPWCGWDNAKIYGFTKHRKDFEDAEEADRIGAVL